MDTPSLESFNSRSREGSDEITISFDIKVAVVSTRAPVKGATIWLAGETRQYKEKLKELGCYWAAKKLKWYYRPAEHKSRRHAKSWDMEDIRNKYGSHFQNAAGSANYKLP